MGGIQWNSSKDIYVELTIMWYNCGAGTFRNNAVLIEIHHKVLGLSLGFFFFAFDGCMIFHQKKWLFVYDHVIIIIVMIFKY
jgi:hypothetical protein